MPTREDVLLELEARGALSPERQAVLDELRARGAFQPKAVSDVKREAAMSSDEYAAANKERVAKGGLNRPQPGTFGAGGLTDLVADPIGVMDEVHGASQFVKRGLLPAVGHVAYDVARPIANAFGADLPESQGTYGEDIDRGAQAYTDAADRIRAERAVGRERLGWAALPVEVIAGAPSVGIKAGTNIVKGANALRGWLEGAKQSAKVGAGFGLAAGTAQSEGGVLERAAGGVGGGLTGLVAGPVLSHALVPAAAAILRNVKNIPGAVRAARTAVSSNPDAITYRGLQRQDMTPRQAQLYLDTGKDLATFGTKQTALPETLGDTGPAMRRLVRAVEAQPGNSSSVAETFLNERQRGSSPLVEQVIPNPAYDPAQKPRMANPAFDPSKPVNQKTNPKNVANPSYEPSRIANPAYMPGQFQRINEQLRRGLKVSNADFAKTKARLTEEQKTASDPLYKEFRGAVDENGAPVEIDVGDILRNSEMQDPDLAPAFKNLMKKARGEFVDEIVLRDMGPGLNNQIPVGKEAVAGRAQSTRLSPARFDSAKQQLDEMISSAQEKGQNNSVRLLTELQKALIARADAATTRNGVSIYERARDAFASPAKMKDALAAGRAFMKGDSEVTGAEYKALTSGEKRMFRIGMAKQARVDTGRKTFGSDSVNYYDRPNVQEVLQEVMTPKEYQRHIALQGREGAMMRSLRATQNSRTAPTQADMADLDWMSRQAESIKDRGLVGYVVHAAAEGVKRLTRMREKDAAAVANIIFEKDPVKQREITTRLEATYGRPRVQRGIAAAVREVRRLERRASGRITQQTLNPALVGELSGDQTSIQPDAMTGQ